MDSFSILSCLLNRDQNIENIRIAHEWFKRKIEIFKDLSLETMSDILTSAKIIERYPNEIIIRQGDVGDSFYVLLNGNASVYINTDFNYNVKGEQQEQAVVTYQSKLSRSARSGNVQKLKLEMKKAIKDSDRRLYGEFIGKYSDGSFFGELALIQVENIRNATIIAEEKCHLLSISRELFDKAIRSYAESIYKEKINFVNSHFLFKNATQKAKYHLAMSLIKIKTYFGQNIITQGQLCNGLILIKKGSAKIVIDLKQHYNQYATYIKQMTSNDSQFHDLIVAAKENKSARCYKENSSRFRRDKIEIAIIGNNDVIGDIEFGFNFPTNILTVITSEICEIYMLENVHVERMINTKRNIETYEMIQYLAELKLNAYYNRCLVFDEMPLLKALLEEINVENELESLTYQVEKQTPKISLLPIFKSGPVIDFYGPGSVFFRNRLKRNLLGVKMTKIEQSENIRNRRTKPNIYFKQETIRHLGHEVNNSTEPRKSFTPLRQKKNTFIDWETSSQHLNNLEERLNNWMSTFTIHGRSKTSISLDTEIIKLPRFKYNNLPEECRFILKYKKSSTEIGDDVDSRNTTRKDEDDTLPENGRKNIDNGMRQYTEMEYYKLKEEMKMKEKRLSVFLMKHSI